MPLTPTQQVRLNVGDRDTPPILTDAEVEHFLERAGGNVSFASGLAARSLAFYFATKADQTTGRMSIGFSARADAYRQMAIDFGVTSAATDPTPVFVGGLSHAAIESSREDSDLVQPAFTRDLHDDPGTQRSDVGGIDQE